MHRLLFAFIITVLALPAFAVTPPPPFEARYVVAVNGLNVGEMERRLDVQPDGSYFVETEMYTTGLVALFKKDRAVERSTWRLHEGEIQPQEYRYEQVGRRGRTSRVIFDWDAGTALFEEDGASERFAVEPGTFDTLSYQVALRFDLARGRTSMEYPVVERRGVRMFRFHVVGEEELQTPIGRLRTVKVERVTDSTKRHTVFWCAVDLDYMLVRIVQENRGDVFSSYLATITELKTPPGENAAP